MAYTKLLRFRHIIISYGNPIIKISCNSFSKNKEIYCCSMPGEVIIDLLSLTVFKNFHFYFIAPAIIGILSVNILMYKYTSFLFQRQYHSIFLYKYIWGYSALLNAMKSKYSAGIRYNIRVKSTINNFIFLFINLYPLLLKEPASAKNLFFLTHAPASHFPCAALNKILYQNFYIPLSLSFTSHRLRIFPSAAGASGPFTNCLRKVRVPPSSPNSD